MQVQQNLAAGAHMKEARAQRSEGLRRAREQQLASNQQRAAQVQEERAAAALAAERIAQERKVAAEELRRQKAEEARAAVERQVGGSCGPGTGWPEVRGELGRAGRRATGARQQYTRQATCRVCSDFGSWAQGGRQYMRFCATTAALIRCAHRSCA